MGTQLSESSQAVADRSAVGSGSWRAMIGLLVLLMPCWVVAGSIAISAARLLPQPAGFTLEVDSAIELNQTLRRGLENGVPLYFNVELRLQHHRRFWFDRMVSRTQRRYSLVYYELTRHYRISVVGEDITRNFRSRLDALAYLGNIRDLLLPLEQPLNPEFDYRAEFEFALDVGALPLALRPQALVSSAWRLHSEEFHWRVN